MTNDQGLTSCECATAVSAVSVVPGARLTQPWHTRIPHAVGHWTLVILWSLGIGHWSFAIESKPVPTIQAIPQPYDQLSFQRDGVEIARYHYGKDLRRPFVFPLVGPSGRSLTRIGHPRDPVSHSHHNSVWVSHNSVDGLSFWDDRSKGRIAHQRVEQLEDLGDVSWVTSLNHWVNEADNNKVLLQERRRTAVHLLPGGESMLVIDLQFQGKDEVTFGKTPFGLVGVRMAKTIGVNDGGGTIRNSEGQVNEKEIFWKPAKWCDYSGPVTKDAKEGITLMDHPENPNHPTVFHVRSDGWMGSSFTFAEPRTLKAGEPLRLKYALYVHAEDFPRERIEGQWKAFAGMKLMDLPVEKK